MSATILIVDDNESNLMFLRFYLERTFIVVTATNGLEAVEMYKTFNPDLILMDIGMPFMNGLEAAKIIKSLDITIPIFAVSGYNEDEKNNSDCFDEYILKPIDIRSNTSENLLIMIQKHLSRIGG